MYSYATASPILQGSVQNGRRQHLRQQTFHLDQAPHSHLQLPTGQSPQPAGAPTHRKCHMRPAVSTSFKHLLEFTESDETTYERRHYGKQTNWKKGKVMMTYTKTHPTHSWTDYPVTTLTHTMGVALNPNFGHFQGIKKHIKRPMRMS